MNVSLNLLWVLLLSVISWSCAEDETAAGKYLATRGAAMTADSDASASDGDEDGEIGALGADDDGDDGDDGDEDDEDADDELSPEEQAEAAALALRMDGKEIYDNQCMGCHMAPAATTLNARDPALLVVAAGNLPHMNAMISDNFPNADMAEAIIAYLEEPL